MLFIFVFPWWAFALLVLFLIFFVEDVYKIQSAITYFTLIKETPSQKDPQLTLNHSFR